jgi:hypothetical protein
MLVSPLPRSGVLFQNRVSDWSWEEDDMRRGFRIAHLVVAILVLAGVVVQPFLVGLFLFDAVNTNDLHTAVGYGLFEVGIPLLLISALLARLPRNEMLLTLLLMADIFLQVLLVGLRDSSSVLAALHPLNAFALLLISISVVKRDLAFLRQAEPDSPAA